MFRFLLILGFLVSPLTAKPETPEAIATEILAPLLDPAKIATLKGDRPVNTRLYKILGWLETAHQRGGGISDVMDTAQAAAGYGGTNTAAADKAAILWTFQKLEKWKCFSAAGVAELKRGGSPLTKAGQPIALDHVLPRSIVPELAAKFFNLEAILAKKNQKKGAKITQREIDLARRWQEAGLLSAVGLEAVEEVGVP